MKDLEQECNKSSNAVMQSRTRLLAIMQFAVSSNMKMNVISRKKRRRKIMQVEVIIAVAFGCCCIWMITQCVSKKRKTIGRYHSPCEKVLHNSPGFYLLFFIESLFFLIIIQLYRNALCVSLLLLPPLIYLSI